MAGQHAKHKAFRHAKHKGNGVAKFMEGLGKFRDIGEGIFKGIVKPIATQFGGPAGGLINAIGDTAFGLSHIGDRAKASYRRGSQGGYDDDYDERRYTD